MPRVDELQGLWTRSLIQWPDGARDTTTQVRWLQGTSAYIDLRQPAPQPAIAAAGLNQLAAEDCLLLAAQEGFAGRFAFDGAFFEWGREIDYQPQPLYSDAGSLWWDGDVLIEKGRDIDYIEHWHRDPARPAAPALALSLRCEATGVNARYLRVGALFMFARDRAVTPPAQHHLTQCVAGAADVRAARALIDCEISFGHIAPAGDRITASTLPWRAGDRLGPMLDRESLTTRDRAPDGRPILRRWEPLAIEGDLSLLAAAVRVI
jgi:hypothetical protein